MPGYTGTKEDFALVLAPLAAGGVRAVAIDLPGQFESPGPDDPAAYGVDALAGTVLAVVGELGGRAHLVGHSFGGLVCRAATIADPAAVASLTLLDSGPGAIGGNRRERMEALEPLLAAGGMAGVYDALELLAAGDPQWLTAPVEHREFLRRRFLAGTEAGLRGMGDALRAEPDRTDALRAAGVPLLVAYGEADDAWPPDGAGGDGRAARRRRTRSSPARCTPPRPSSRPPPSRRCSYFWAGVDATPAR